MQDIVFYAAANETLGIVRDYANVRNQSAPVLTLGVSVCLRIRLFAATEGAAPYPIASFNSISNWEWSMDGDFDRSTASKLVADEGNISVHTVTDTVNGETRSFTEFVIPISNMNTQELAAWLGTEKTRSGLTGELVGYDSSENAAFVLQIENFTVRNRVAGLGDPTVMDQEIVTRTQAERMIQTAVSSSAATKQDKLTSANGGTGISVSSSGVISVSNVPQSAVTGLTASLAGLSASLATKQNTLSAGYRMAIVSGSTVEQARYFAIEPAITAPANQTTTVVLSAGKAYEIHAVATNANVLLNREEPVGGTHTFALEGHAEIFVANTGYIQTGSNVVLSQPLEPDAINYCTVRFRRGMAIISVEDHIGGYIVVSSGTSGAGTLNYALASAGSSYVAFNDTLAGLTIDMGGAVTNGEKHVVGNGYSDTILTGGVSCTNKTTFANLAMSGAYVTGGTMTFGDVFIPSGATVAVSGGGLAIEKVSGNGGTINLGGTNVYVSSGQHAGASGCTFTGGSTSFAGGAIYTLGDLTVTGCTFVGNSATARGAALYIQSVGSNRVMNITSCLVSGNVTGFGAVDVESGCTAVITGSTITANTGNAYGGGVFVNGGGSAVVSNSIVSGNIAGSASTADFAVNSNGTVTLAGGVTAGKCAVGGVMIIVGSNRVDAIVSSNTVGGSVTISSGAIIDLTGNTNATPINPGGGITFEQGGATVYPSAGSASAYMLGGMTVPKITNTTTVDFGGTTASIPYGVGVSAQGCDFVSGGSTTFAILSATAQFTNCGFDSCGAVFSGGNSATHVLISGCSFGSANAVYQGVANSGTFEFVSCTFDDSSDYWDLKFQENQGHIIFDNNNIGLNNIFMNMGDVTFKGSNTFRGRTHSISPGTIIVSSGAIIDLTGNTNATPITPAIAIPAGAIVTIIGSGGSSGYFSELALTGSTITNAGLIYGATVTVPAAGGPWEVNTTEGDSTLEATSTEQQVVISGGVSYIGGL